MWQQEIMPPQRSLLEDLALGDTKAQRSAISALMERAKSLGLDEMSSVGPVTRVLAGEWRTLRVDRGPVIAALARTMVARSTSGLVVNFIAYALATAGEDGITELLPLLSHRTFWVRAYAAEGLGCLDNGARWAVPALCRVVSRDVGWNALIVVRALGNIGGKEALAKLNWLASHHRRRIPPDEEFLKTLEEALAAALAQE